jgi:hypothetical protein
MLLKDKAVMLTCLLALVFVTVLLFIESLPTWCSTPQVGSNHIVQPLCKKTK